jgi:curved DNA-binding protein CbpA
MTDFDPYLVLAVPRAANDATIKAAYRARVQVSHPDRGGNPAEFMQVVRAFGILADPEARRLFDQVGVVDEDAVKAYRRDVAGILADMFDAAVSTAVATGLQLERVDFIKEMSTAVRTGLVDAKVSLKELREQMDGLEKLQRRIRRHKEGDNLFAQRLGAQLDAKNQSAAQVRRRLALLETALVELGNYGSEVELISALAAEAEPPPA